MRKVRTASPHLADMRAYDPKYLPAQCVLSANESAIELPEELKASISEALNRVPLNRYPDPLANKLRSEIAQSYGLSCDQVLIGNGGDELLFNIALAWGGPGRICIDCPPTFSVYAHNAQLNHTQVVEIPRKADFSSDEEAILERVSKGDIDYLILTSPNNPTGNLEKPQFLRRLLESSDTLVLLDEAYVEFSDTSMVDYVKTYPNLAILRTFSKAYRLAGLRLGYLLASPEVVSELLKVRQPYSVDTFSQIVGEKVYRSRDIFLPAIDEVVTEREKLYEKLHSLKELEVFPSFANYLLMRVAGSHEIWQGLYDEGILVRDFSHAKGLKNCLRVSIGSPEENEAFYAALKELLNKRKGLSLEASM